MEAFIQFYSFYFSIPNHHLHILPKPQKFRLHLTATSCQKHPPCISAQQTALTWFYNIEILQLHLQIMLQQRNDKTQEQMIKLFKDFYLVALQGHNRNQQKKQVLDLFFRRMQSSSKNHAEVLISTAKYPYESQATIPDEKVSQCTSNKPHLLASNMAHANFLSNYTDKSELSTFGWVTKAGQPFTSKYVHKILIFSFWINFLKTKTALFLSQFQENLFFSHEVAKQCLKQLKQAMEKALQWLKQVDRRKFVKNFYLYRQLLNYTEKEQLEYICVIIEELDNDFLAKAFEYFWEEESELVYSRSIMEGSSFEVNFSSLVMLEEINMSLERMNAHLVLVEAGSEVFLDTNKCVNIVIEELPSGMYSLKDIITLRCPAQPF